VSNNILSTGESPTTPSTAPESISPARERACRPNLRVVISRIIAFFRANPGATEFKARGVLGLRESLWLDAERIAYQRRWVARSGEKGRYRYWATRAARSQSDITRGARDFGDEDPPPDGA
jgi:hypothetical protein